MVSVDVAVVLIIFFVGGLDAEAFSNKWNFQSNNAFNTKIKVLAGEASFTRNQL